jgi:cephalosporin hydroxylase
MLHDTFSIFARDWRNTRADNDAVYQICEKRVDSIPYLKRHFDIITEHKLGFGEKAFRYFWAMVFTQVAKDYPRFLEIGVYKGSILALSQLIATHLGLDLTSIGVTPLAPVGDKYSTYDHSDYRTEIIRTFELCHAPLNSIHIIPGLSTDPNVKEAARMAGPYDVIYIDGGHDYATVLNDLRFADLALKRGGLIVMDDCSCGLDISTWPGHPEVSAAAETFFKANGRYKHLFACGHNRVWRG